MSPELARTTIDQAIPDLRDKNPIIMGLNILTKYDPDLTHDTHNSQIYAGNFETLVEMMSEDDIFRMASWGWFEDEESWAHNC